MCNLVNCYCRPQCFAAINSNNKPILNLFIPEVLPELQQLIDLIWLISMPSAWAVSGKFGLFDIVCLSIRRLLQFAETAHTCPALITIELVISRSGSTTPSAHKLSLTHQFRGTCNSCPVQATLLHAAHD